MLGTPFMPWQQEVADVACEVDPATGRLAYRNVVLTVPRQSGKTTLILALILWRALLWGRQNIVYTAQDAQKARAKWQDDWLPVLEASPFKRYYGKPRLQNGSEGLKFRNGSHQSLMATRKSSGHGPSLDLAILDEAFAQVDARIEDAVSPTMITREQPQFWVVSTAGTPDQSPYLLRKVETGRQLVEQGVTSGNAYFEWSAADELPVEDPATWWACMPALGRTVTEDVIRGEFDKAVAENDLSGFERAYLNRWKVSVADPVIPLDAWDGCLDGRRRPEAPADPIWVAIDVAGDRSSASIAFCGPRKDGKAYVEVLRNERGTEWVVPKLVEMYASRRPAGLIVDKGGPAKSLLPEFARAGLEVTEVTMSDYAAACGLFYDTVMSRKLWHVADPRLVAAISGAQKRPLGDAWAWSRRGPATDITPLVASTLALWGHAQAPKLRLVGAVIDPNDDGEEHDPVWNDDGGWQAIVAGEEDW